MSRPLKYDTGPVVSITVDGHGVAWCNGIFTNEPGSREVGHAARKAARVGLTYHFRRCEVTADSETPLGALAAMASWAPGRVVIHKAPEEALEALAAGITHV